MPRAALRLKVAIGGYDGRSQVRLEPAALPFVRAGDKVGRNDPCPCGSGQKFKRCHGR